MSAVLQLQIIALSIIIGRYFFKFNLTNKFINETSLLYDHQLNLSLSKGLMYFFHSTSSLMMPVNWSIRSISCYLLKIVSLSLFMTGWKCKFYSRIIEYPWMKIFLNVIGFGACMCSLDEYFSSCMATWYLTIMMQEEKILPVIPYNLSSGHMDSYTNCGISSTARVLAKGPHPTFSALSLYHSTVFPK